MQACYLFIVTPPNMDSDSNEMNAALQSLSFISCLGTSLWKHHAYGTPHPATTSSWNRKFSV